MIAAELTDLGLSCERLPATAFLESIFWCYFAEYAPGSVFTGGVPTTASVMSLIVCTLEGGLDPAGKRHLISGATGILARHSRSEGLVPAYVVIREVAPSDWGIFGEEGSLQCLRYAPPDTPPL